MGRFSFPKMQTGITDDPAVAVRPAGRGIWDVVAKRLRLHDGVTPGGFVQVNQDDLNAAITSGIGFIVPAVSVLVADNSVAINAALATGKTVYIGGAGDYPITHTIVVGGGSLEMSPKASLRVDADIVGMTIGANGRVTGVRLKPGVNTTHPAYDVTGYDVTLQDVRTIPTSTKTTQFQDGFRFHTLYTASLYTLWTVNRSTSRYGVLIDEDVNDLSFYSLQIGGAGAPPGAVSAGVYISATFTTLRFYGPVIQSATVGFNFANTSATRGYAALIDHAYFEANKTSDIVASNVFDLTISSGWFGTALTPNVDFSGGRVVAVFNNVYGPTTTINAAPVSSSTRLLLSGGTWDPAKISTNANTTLSYVGVQDLNGVGPITRNDQYPYLVPVNVATPDLSVGTLFVTQNTQATTWADFSGLREGNEITIIAGDAYTTIDFSASNIYGNSGADYTMAVGDMLKCTHRNGHNYCFVSKK